MPKSNKDKPAKKGTCCICGEETDLYCNSCAYTFGKFAPTWYCNEHYEKVVMTGNCCSGNEKNYTK